jgi:hypothetical protein
MPIRNQRDRTRCSVQLLLEVTQALGKKLRRGRRGQSCQLLGLEMAAETVENNRSIVRTVDNPGNESILRDLSGQFVMLTLESKRTRESAAT